MGSKKLLLSAVLLVALFTSAYKVIGSNHVDDTDYDYTIVEVVTNECYQRMGYVLDGFSPIDYESMSVDDAKVLADNISTLDYATSRVVSFTQDDDYDTYAGEYYCRGYYEKSDDGAYTPVTFSGDTNTTYTYKNNEYIKSKKGRYLYDDATGIYVKKSLIDEYGNDYIIEFKPVMDSDVSSRWDFRPLDYSLVESKSEDSDPYRTVKYNMTPANKELYNSIPKYCSDTQVRGYGQVSGYVNSDCTESLVYSDGLDSLFSDYNNIKLEVVRYDNLSESIIKNADFIYFNQSHDKELGDLYKKYNNSGKYSTSDCALDFSSGDLVKLLITQVANNDLKVIFDKVNTYSLTSRLNYFEQAYYLLLSSHPVVLRNHGVVDDFTIDKFLNSFPLGSNTSSYTIDTLEKFNIKNPLLSLNEMYEHNVILLPDSLISTNLDTDMIADSFEDSSSSSINTSSVRILEIEPCNSYLSDDYWKYRLYGVDPYFNGSIEVTRMQSKEFAGITTNLIDRYDMVYIGDDYSELNHGSNLVQIKNKEIVMSINSTEVFNVHDYVQSDSGVKIESVDLKGIEGCITKVSGTSFSVTSSGVAQRGSIKISFSSGFIELYFIVIDDSFNSKNISFSTIYNEDTVLDDFDKKCYNSRKSLSNYLPVENIQMGSKSWLSDYQVTQNATSTLPIGSTPRSGLDLCENASYWLNESPLGYPNYAENNWVDSANFSLSFTEKSNCITLNKIYACSEFWQDSCRFACSDDNVTLVARLYTPNMDGVRIFTYKANKYLDSGMYSSLRYNLWGHTSKYVNGSNKCSYIIFSLEYRGSESVDDSYWSNLFKSGYCRFINYTGKLNGLDLYQSSEDLSSSHFDFNNSLLPNNYSDYTNSYVSDDLVYDTKSVYESSSDHYITNDLGTMVDDDYTNVIFNYYYRDVNGKIVGASVDNMLKFYIQKPIEIDSSPHSSLPTIYNDSDMDGIVYTGVGDIEFVTPNLQYESGLRLFSTDVPYNSGAFDLGSGGSTSVRTSGNDISSKSVDLLMDFASVGKSVVLSDDFLKFNAIDSSSHMYRLSNSSSVIMDIDLDDSYFKRGISCSVLSATSTDSKIVIKYNIKSSDADKMFDVALSCDDSVKKDYVSVGSHTIELKVSDADYLGYSLEVFDSDKKVYAVEGFVEKPAKSGVEINVLQITKNESTNINLQDSEFQSFANDTGYMINVDTVTEADYKNNLDDYDVVLLGFYGFDAVDSLNNKELVMDLYDYSDDGGNIIFTYNTIPFGMGDISYMTYLFRDKLGMDRYGLSTRSLYPKSDDLVTSRDTVYSANYGLFHNMTKSKLMNFNSFVGYDHDIINNISVMENIRGFSDYYTSVASENFKKSGGSSSTLKKSDVPSATRAMLVNRSPLTDFPYRLEDTIEIGTEQASFYQLNLENKDVDIAFCLDIDGYNDCRSGYYAYSVGNSIYLGIGGSASSDEYKLLVNAIVYLGTDSDTPVVTVDGFNQIGSTFVKYVDSDILDKNVITLDIDLNISNLKGDSYIRVRDSGVAIQKNGIDLPKEKIKYRDKEIDVYKLDGDGIYDSEVSVGGSHNITNLVFDVYNISDDCVKTSVKVSFIKRFLFDLE